uniref:C2H2-type domain-containing protein n=1 Tax=Macrostomum lignano TaxID=282301 RepID=A0A1I8H3Y6_9PLAT
LSTAMLLPQVLRGVGRSLTMTCEEEPLSDIQLQELDRRRANLERFQSGMRPLAEAVNVVGTAEEAATDANGLLLTSSLGVLAHAGVAAAHEALAQQDWRLDRLLTEDGAPAVICQRQAQRSSPVKGALAGLGVGDEEHQALDLAESAFQHRDQGAIHISSCVQRPKHNGLLVQGRGSEAVAATQAESAADEEGLPLLEEGIEIVTFGDDPNQLYVHDSQNPCDQDGNTVLVALDVYYFARQECQQASQPEPRQDLRFRCHLCSKILYSNLSTVRHILGHFEPASQSVSALLQDCSTEIVRCPACPATFAGHYQLAEHRADSHLTPAGRKLCRVCDREFANTEQFARHMRTRHLRRQMPYACQLCSFRTSVLRDILTHFCRMHAASPHLLCPLCLKAIRITFPSSSGAAYAPGAIGGDSSGLTGVFTQHLQRHFDDDNSSSAAAASSSGKRCNQCQLSFVTKSDLNMHQQLDHRPGDLQQLEDLEQHQQSASPQKGPGSSQQLKSLNAAPAETARDLSGVALPPHLDSAMLCLECRRPLNGPDHRHYVPCTAGQCRYATCCGPAYQRHVASHASAAATPPVAMETDDSADKNEDGLGDFYCPTCGFATDSGDNMAEHLEAGACGSQSALLLPEMP